MFARIGIPCDWNEPTDLIPVPSKSFFCGSSVIAVVDTKYGVVVKEMNSLG